MGINEEAAKKAEQTKREKYGEDVFSNWGKQGKGKKKTSGFAWLKEHDPEKFRKIIKERQRIRRSR